MKSSTLVHDKTKSCGCLHKEVMKQTNKPTHGWSRHKLYGVWSAMMSRCYNKDSEKFMGYGGRGIFVHPSWWDVATFCEDNIAYWTEGLSIDRVDNDGPYSKENTRWTTQTEQMRNVRRNRHVFVDGRRVTLAEAEEVTGWIIKPAKGSKKTIHVYTSNPT